MTADLESQLVPFVQEAKRSGASDAFIVELLKASGWPERRIYAAFSSYYGKVTGMPVPVRGNRFEYASDGFLYLLAFISLACWATGAGHLLYVLIDELFPNALDEPNITATLRDRVSLELATIIVAYPIFVTVSAFIKRQLANRPESADSGVRKWLTYIALVIAATVLLGDAIYFLQNFLHGDLTVRCILDTLVLFGIVGSIFAYYLATLRGEPVSAPRDRVFLALSVTLVVGTLICGFGNLGWPERQHRLSLDERRIADLTFIQSRISADYLAKRDTPAVLPAGINRRDPQTQLPYGYERIDARRYRLCSDFATVGASPIQPQFAHPDRRACFMLAADSP
jgi:hypothetical protein